MNDFDFFGSSKLIESKHSMTIDDQNEHEFDLIMDRHPLYISSINSIECDTWKIFK